MAPYPVRDAAVVSFRLIVSVEETYTQFDIYVNVTTRAAIDTLLPPAALR